MSQPEMVIGNFIGNKDETDLFLHVHILHQNLEAS